MTEKVRITIRVDETVKRALELEARRHGRPFADHLRAKIEAPVESVEDRLGRLERKVLFVALAQQKLFEGLDLETHLDALMMAIDDPYDPFEETRANA
ncbi:MAG: hypothetical protein AAGC95_08210 [Pseudomonadota bacterium]